MASTNVRKIPAVTARNSKPYTSCERRNQLFPQLQVRLSCNRPRFISVNHDLLPTERSTRNRSVCVQATHVRSACSSPNKRFVRCSLRNQSNRLLHASVLQQTRIHRSLQRWNQDDFGKTLLTFWRILRFLLCVRCFPVSDSLCKRFVK